MGKGATETYVVVPVRRIVVVTIRRANVVSVVVPAAAPIDTVSAFRPCPKIYLIYFLLSSIVYWAHAMRPYVSNLQASFRFLPAVR